MRVMIGLTKPRRAIIGIVLAGEIESAGKSAKRFKIGDKVYGVTGFGLGAYAEYKCMKETDSKHGCLAHKPANISFEAATVAAYGGLLALQYLEQVFGSQQISLSWSQPKDFLHEVWKLLPPSFGGPPL